MQKWIVTLMCCALVFSAALADSDTRSQMDRGAGYTYIAGETFSYCYKLRAFELDIKHPTLRTVNGALVSRADGRLICYPCGLAEGECRVSEEISSIGDLAFYDCDRLTAVRLPAGLTAIGANPFRSCKNLAEIIVDGEASAFSTVDGALIDGANDRLICYPCAFAAAEYCLPETIRAIGDYALYECAALTKVELPDGLKTIGNGAFAYCFNLQTIELPDGLTSIGDYAFSGCRNLYALRLPDGLKDVGEHAFDGCPNLTLVVSRGSRAEKYCKQHELDYAFAGEE